MSDTVSLYDQIMAIAPPEVSRLSKEDIWLRVYDMSDGKLCWNCHHAIVFGSSWSSCPHCQAPFPHQCAFSGCRKFALPSKTRSGDFVDPSPYCRVHMQHREEESRTNLLEAIPAGVLADAKSYHTTEGRKKFIKHMGEWVKGNGTFANLFIDGLRGVGKTVSAAAAAYRLIRSGKVSSVVWCTEYELMQMCRHRTSRDPTEPNGFRFAFEAELLIVDEMFLQHPDAMFKGDKAALKDFFYQRFEDLQKRTIMTSTMPASTFRNYYDEGVDSRMQYSTTLLTLRGPDHRQEGGGQQSLV